MDRIIDHLKLTGFPYHTEPSVIVFIGGEALAFTVTMLTVGYQARRAAAADRVKCLKYE